MHTDRNCLLSKNCDDQKDFIISIKTVFSELNLSLLHSDLFTSMEKVEPTANKTTFKSAPERHHFLSQKVEGDSYNDKRMK